MEITDNKFLGIGWKFPPSFSKLTHNVTMVSEEANVHNSLQVLIATLPRERIMQPDYGCSLNDFLFEPLDTALAARMTDRIEAAIIKFEPRVRVIKVNLEDLIYTEGKINIHVHFEIKATNSRYNLVYPYYIEEGRVQP